MTRYVDHVINTAGDPVISILVAACAVAGGIDIGEAREIGLDKAFMIAVNRAHLARPAILDHKVAIGGAGQFLALVIEQGRYNAKEWQGGRARFQSGRTRQRCQQDAAGFGLPPGINNRTFSFADMLVIPFPGFRVDRFTNRTKDTQGRKIGLVHPLLAFAH